MLFGENDVDTMKNRNEIKKRYVLTVIQFALILIVLAVFNTGMGQLVPWTQVLDFNSLPNSPGDGWAPNAIVISGNAIYGTTFSGNSNVNGDPALLNDGTGTIYKINTDGTSYIDLHDFSSNTNDLIGANFDGANPWAGLLLCSNILYGTARVGGANGNGTIFAIGANGENFTTIFSFPSEADDDESGINPKDSLIISSNVLYGTAENGGAYDCGTVFKVNTDRTGFTDIHDFTDSPGPDADGTGPTTSLTLYSNTLYGTTIFGGSGTGQGGGVIFSLNTDGSDYSILHNFTTSNFTGDTNSDGSNPNCNLTLGSNILYGTTSAGGVYGNGTIYEINPDGTGFATIFSFTNDSPSGSLTFANGRLYGVESSGIVNGLFILNTDGTGFVPLNTYDDAGVSLSSLQVSQNTIYAVGLYSSNNVDIILAINPPQPVINSIVLNTNGSVTLSCSGGPYFTYLMQSSTDLAPPVAWETVSTNVADSNGDWQFTDDLPTNLVYGMFTNYTYSGNFNINLEATNIITGTNISYGYVPEYPHTFYRIAGPP